MRSIQWESVESSTEGGFPRIEPGAYVGVIGSMEDFPSKEYVQMLYDVAEGPRKGYYSDAFYVNKPWAHNFYLSYKNTALGMLKGRLETIGECNPGFDPFAAWDAERLDMFIGRKVGIVLREEEYWDKKTEEFRIGSPKCFRLCKLDDVSTIKAPEPNMLDDAGKVAALVKAGYGQVEAQAKLDEIKAAGRAEAEADASSVEPPF